MKLHLLVTAMLTIALTFTASAQGPAPVAPEGMGGGGEREGGKESVAAVD